MAIIYEARLYHRVCKSRVLASCIFTLHPFYFSAFFISSQDYGCNPLQISGLPSRRSALRLTAASALIPLTLITPVSAFRSLSAHAVICVSVLPEGAAVFYTQGVYGGFILLTPPPTPHGASLLR